LLADGFPHDAANNTTEHAKKRDRNNFINTPCYVTLGCAIAER
jgi:hypothetical protein